MNYSDREIESDGDDLGIDILDSNDFFNDGTDEDENDQSNDKERDNSEKIKEKTVEKKLKPKRIVKNPRVTLNFDALRGPNGLSALKKMFVNFKFKGSNHEKEDLMKIMNIIQQWMCYKLCPSFGFESSLLQLEVLGKKKVVQTLLKKYRLGMDDWGEKKSDSEDETKRMETEDADNQNFDKFLQDEIINANVDMVLSQDEDSNPPEEQLQQQQHPRVTLTQEQLERIARNRKLAEEKRMKQSSKLQTQNRQFNALEISKSDSDILMNTIN